MERVSLESYNRLMYHLERRKIAAFSEMFTICLALYIYYLSSNTTTMLRQILFPHFTDEKRSERVI